MKQKKYLTFTDLKNPETRDQLISWWKELDKSRGDRAQLRRCHSPIEVAFVPAYHRLRWALKKSGPVNDEQLALVAGILSHVKENIPGSFAIQMAGSDSADGKKARVSGLRFRRLLAIDDHQKLYETMIRMVHLLGDTVDIPSLANGIYWWNARTKKEWAFAYYEHAPSEEK